METKTGKLPALPETGSTPEFALGKRKAFIVVFVCWLLVVFDGYDLIVYGTVQSSLLAEADWGLDRASSGTLGSLAFLGMLLGALFAGRISDSLGRRTTILACTIVFSVFTVLCAFAPNPIWPIWFGLFRLIAGLGLGGLMPSVNAMAAELVPPRFRALTATVMMSGVPIGGSLAALLGIVLIPSFGWHSMFLVAALALIVVLPVAWKVLPETLRTKPAAQGSPAAVESGFRQLLRPPYRSASLLFALATLGGLFAWYGLGIWLPSLMQTAGHDLGSALTFALALNLGAVAGSLLSAAAGDRFGPVRVAMVTAAIAAAALAALLLNPPTAVVYALLVLAGIGMHGTQCLILAAIANLYPSQLRGTALGWALGVGRIGAVAAPQVGGLLLVVGLGVNANFLVFAIAAALASIALSVIFGLSRRSEAL
ncbi:aromatic acid/H+ symport family MFS transporter [Acaricomes phytoseiuli]|uniref:MFS transporter n=1 Tax=Acaricomes phytoseiuli TaxID=291968 RepID=UPI00035DE59C|nr:aromatic acid/H+ symport family MFS transporter [Acaricomes phytoseiuli]MCW1250019.1 aromatic acid/H+ symport family MFS transporter [Acaricomes phytoseiuli]